MPEIFRLNDYKEKIKNYTGLKKVTDRYPFKITSYYDNLIEKYSKRDPIYLQSFPDFKEIENSRSISNDPFREKNKQNVDKFIHRYPNRGVLLLNNICLVHCRHCMRKRIWTKKKYELNTSDINNIVSYCEKNNIEDVIISGGDPLLSEKELLDEVITKLSGLNSIKLIRIGSRLPVVAPQKINKKIISLFNKHRNLYLLTHFNHPRELTDLAMDKVKQIVKTGTYVFNQSVLLKGVNDSYKILSELFMNLLKNKIKPYYLHQCDLVKGTTHFWVKPEKGISILKKLEGYISGLAIPYFAVDLPGGKGKVLLGPNSKINKKNGKYYFKNYKGEEIIYYLNQ